MSCADLTYIDAILGVTFMEGGGREPDILEGAKDVTTVISLDTRYEGPQRFKQSTYDKGGCQRCNLKNQIVSQFEHKVIRPIRINVESH